MDAATRVCLPFDPRSIPVLGDNPRAWVPGMKGSEKVETWMRRQTLAVVFTQAAATTDDLVSAAPATAVNLLSAGGPIGSVQAGDSGTGLGFPAGYVLTYQDSNMYPGGLFCQPKFEFVIVGISVRPKPLFRFTGSAVVRHSWMDAYEKQIQQMALEAIVLTFARNRETCSILMDNLPTYPTGFSNGAQGATAPNGDARVGEIRPLCVALPVGAESASASSATPDSKLTIGQRAITHAANATAPTNAQLTAADPLIAPFEFQFYGYCRCRNPNADACQPGGYVAPDAPTPG